MLNKSDLSAIRKLVKNEVEIGVKNGVRNLPAKKDVEDIVFNKLSEFHANMAMPELGKLRSEMKDGFNKVEGRLTNVEERLTKVEGSVSFLKDEVRGLTAEISDSVNRTEFEGLKKKVEIHASANLP